MLLAQLLSTREEQDRKDEVVQLHHGQTFIPNRCETSDHPGIKIETEHIKV